MGVRERLQGTVSTVADLITVGGVVALAAGSVAGWLASTNRYFQSLAPVSYIFVGLLAAILAVLLIWALWAFGRWLRHGTLDSPGVELDPDVFAERIADKLSARQAATDAATAPEPTLRADFDWQFDRLGRTDVTLRALVSTDRRAKDVAVVARFATEYQALGMPSPEWRWSKSDRIIDRQDLIPGETITGDIFVRPKITQDQPVDTLRILGEEFDLSKANAVNGFVVLIEMTAAMGAEKVTNRLLLKMRLAGGQQTFDVLDKPSFSHVEDNDTLR